MWKEILRSAVKATFPITVCFFSTTLIIAQAPDVSYQPVIGPGAGLSAPMEVVSAPGDAAGRFFVVEKAGTIRIWTGTALLPTPFLDISAQVADDGERGLLSMAFHPQYASNGYFFVYYNNNAGNITVARYSVSSNPNVANPTPDPVTPLISIPKPFSNHNGGHLQFRVEGGVPYLYFATGDGGSGNDPNNLSQDQDSYLGKMIRINVNVTPFVPEIWAWGLRNPFRWSFDRVTGDIWIGDVGQDAREEINFLAGGNFGANYGWPCVEGAIDNPNAPAALDCDTVRSVDILPVLDYVNPAEGSSIVGGYVYRGAEYPALQGYYMATDFYSGRFWMIRPASGGGWDVEVTPGYPTNISSISETEDGSLYAVSLSAGTVSKLVIPIVTPLRLISFSGTTHDGYNELKWISESEAGVDRFVIEWGTDGRLFNPAGELEAANNAGRNYYTFKHNINNVRTIYYRLRMNDVDGRYTYSPVIALGAEGLTGIRIYPTIITTGQLNAVAASPVEKIIIHSSDGRQVYARDMNGITGYFNIPLPALSKGVYLVRITGPGLLQKEKIFIE